MKTRATLATLVLVILGCETPIGVSRPGGDSVFREVTANALEEGRASEFSKRELARHSLLDRFDSQPKAALSELHRAAVLESSNRDQLFALAELSFLQARKTRSRESFLAAVVYAYLYLFSDGSHGALEPYDPRFRLACDLYNRGLSEFLETRTGDAELKHGSHPLPFGTMEIAVSRPGFPWGPEEFGRFLPAGDFRVRGLRSRHRHAGLGASLIALRTAPSVDSDNAEARFLPRWVKTPATAFLRIEEPAEALSRGSISASLELYAPFKTLEIDVAGSPVPLEADITVPVAYALEEPRLWEFEVGGFFSSDVELETGMYMLYPYSRGKIPVVFVHGTASSPARWANMFNGLQGYPELRERFQFWFFIYTTGNPIAYSASLFRESLRDIVSSLDPEGSDRALREIVVVGHSQGGLLTKMLTIDSEDRFWRALTPEKEIHELDLTVDETQLLRRTFYFERVPQVRRVIFIATPHRGSFFAASWIGRLAGSMISLPKRIATLGRALFVRNRSAFPPSIRDTVPTSIRSMDPENPFIRALSAIPVPADVKSHSIIAVTGSGPVEEGSDGVVEYSSAHLQEAESELVIRSGHSCQSHSVTIAEVRRILLEHLKETDGD